MQKWEYFVAPLLPHNPGEILNSFGDDGWELVNGVMQQTPSGGVSIVAYLKRPKPYRRTAARVYRRVATARALRCGARGSEPGPLRGPPATVRAGRRCRARSRSRPGR